MQNLLDYNFGVPKHTFLRFLLLQFGIRLIREHEFVKYAQARDLSSLLLTNINWFEKFSGGNLNIDVLLNTKSQMGQEIFAHIVNGFAPGYFLEVGVGNHLRLKMRLKSFVGLFCFKLRSRFKELNLGFSASLK